MLTRIRTRIRVRRQRASMTSAIAAAGRRQRDDLILMARRQGLQ